MKKFALLLTVMMITNIFAGCTAENQSAPADFAPIAHDEPKPVVITVVTSYGGDDGNRSNYEKAYKEYEAVSGNIVKDASGVSNEDWKSGVISSFENGTEPDVVFYFTGADSNRFVEGQKVVPIDEIRSVYPDYASNMRDDMLAKSPIDGKQYAIPVNGYWEGLFVNKKVLADCGVEVPDANTTWDQFLGDCQKISDKGYIPIAASMMDIPHYCFEYSVFNNSTIESHPLLPESSSDAIGQNWAAGLNDMKTLYDRGFFPNNTTTATSAETDALMTTNQAAFMIDGVWKMGWFAENAADIKDFTVTYVPGKGMRKSTDLIGGLSMGYFITRKAWDNPEKQAACIEFITAMTTDEVVATFGITAVTALKEGIPPPADANHLVRDALEMTANVTSVVAATEDGLSHNSRKDLFANVKNILTGEMTAEEAIDHCLSIQD